MSRTDLRPRPDPTPYLGAPRSTPLADDHAVDLRGDALVGCRVALVVCGGIASFKAPLTVRALRRQGADVTVFASTDALRYVAEDTLAWASLHPVVTRLSPQAEHLSGAAPFDVYLVAPATYNTINKLAMGIADNVPTTLLASALGRLERGEAAVLVAPTMHGTMHNRVLHDNLVRLTALGVRVIPPRDAYGKDNIPDEPVLVAEVAAARPRAPLRGRRVVVIGGPFRDSHGRLSAEHTTLDGGARIAEDLIHQGAQVLHLSLPTPRPLSAITEPIVRDTPEALAQLVADALHSDDWDMVIDCTDITPLFPLPESWSAIHIRPAGHRWLLDGPCMSASEVAVPKAVAQFNDVLGVIRTRLLDCVPRRPSA